MRFLSPLMSSPSTLVDLPTEVIGLVFDTLDQGSKCSLRLTCRRLASIGLNNLMHEVHLIFTKEGFERLDQIPQHPAISKSIISLYYEGDCIPNYPIRKSGSGASVALTG